MNHVTTIIIEEVIFFKLIGIHIHVCIILHAKISKPVSVQGHKKQEEPTNCIAIAVKTN